MSVLDRLNGYLRHQTTTGIQLRELDAFRGWACLGVVFLHCLGQTGKPGFIVTISSAAVKIFLLFFRQGGFGLDLFFFISGFLLFIKFGKAYYEGKPVPSVPAFYKRRFFRIAPAYYANLVLALTLWAFVYSGHLYFQWDTKDFLYHLFFMHNLSPVYSQSINPVLWTLAIEVQFYLVLPFIAGWFYGRRWLISMPAILLASATYKLYTISLAMPLDHIQDINVALTPFNQLFWRLDQFVIGMCFANLWLYVTIRKVRPAFLTNKWFAHLLVFVGVCTILGVVKLRQDYIPISASYWALLSPLVCIGFGMLVFGTLYCGALKGIIANRYIEFIGIISYSIYLWHIQVVIMLNILLPGLVKPGVGNFLARVAIVLPVSIAVGIVSYMAFERPFLKGTEKKNAFAFISNQTQGRG